MNDAYSQRDGNRIQIGTSKIALELELTDSGAFFLRSLKHMQTGKEYVQTALMRPDEFSVIVDGEEIRGASGGFSLEEIETNVLSQGELETTVSLRRGGLLIERHYIAYPGLAVVQSYTTYKNISDQPMAITRPSLYVIRLLTQERQHTDFSYMTGGANFTGSQIYKTVPLHEGFTRTFDSQTNPEITKVDGVEGNWWHERFNGAGIWNEFFTLSPQQAQEGLWITFDYQGWWKATMTCCDGDLALCGHCELLSMPLAPKDTLQIAPMTYGFYCGDMDDMGNSIQEYIYQYKWDYTRDKYFNRMTMGIWHSAPLTDAVYKMVDIARYAGYERIHVDDFWFDAKGNWNGIFGDDWREINRYIQKNGMFFRLWMPPWHADRLSQVWLDHPEWMLDFHGNWYNWTIDMSQEEAYQWVLNMLCEKQREFGDYELRVDGDPCNLTDNEAWTCTAEDKGGWNCTHKQSENFYRLYREFKENNPRAGLNGCSSGGHTLGIESARYTDQQQITDGWCLHYGGYYTTLLLPIDKHMGLNISGARGSWKEHPASAREIFSAPGLFMKKPSDEISPDVLEEYRKDAEMFRFLRLQGVYGRWIKVFRPTLENSDPTFALERMTWNLEKGLLMISANPLNPLLGKSDRVFPKGLSPQREYLIESRLGSVPAQTKTGAEWMREGIFMENVAAGEVLYINLPDRPGTGSIHELPAPPSALTCEPAEWLRRKGMALSWKAPEQDSLISYYEIAKNGVPYTKVSIGNYYFDANAEPSAKYAVRSVDFDGQASNWIHSDETSFHEGGSSI